jgi:ankyrin repeat protein
MKTKLLLGGILLIAATFVSAATNDLSGALQKGLFEEEANRNLDAAIQAYQSVAARFDKDRQLAATAIFRLGECYRKLGKTNEAVVQYERIVREFSDQQPIVTLSRQNLAGIQISLGTIPGVLIPERPIRAPIAITDDEENEIRRIQAMIKNSPDLINAPGEGGFTPLCRAANLAQLRVAEFLLSNGADVNLNRPLSHAADAGHKAMVELFLRRGAAVNAADGSGQTALHHAAERGFLSVCEILLAAKADPNLRDDTLRTPLTLAVENGSRPVAAALFARGADANIVSRTRKGYGTDRTTAGAPLHFAVARGDEAMVTLLLTNRVDLTLRNSSGESPLDIAAILGKATIAAQLLAAGADVKDTGSATGGPTPLHYAVSYGHSEVVKLLLEHGANPNAAAVVGQPGVTSLMIAAGRGETEIVSLLLKQKADPNLLDAEGNTALWNAIHARKVDVVKLLLANGANPDQPNFDGYPPLVLAIGMLQDKDIVAALLDARADANAKDKYGMTPLHSAVLINRKNFVELLLAKGAEVNIRNKYGQTPLEIAKSTNSPDSAHPSVVLGGFGATGVVGAIPVKSETTADQPGEVAALLRRHGALDDLPDFSSIRITRGTLKPILVFDADSLNHFTLLEAIQNYYGSVGGPVDSPSGFSARLSAMATGANGNTLKFPDFSRITIYRPATGKPEERKGITVNILTATNGIDCAKDVPLEFGDVIEIPEREHRLAEQAVTLTDQQSHDLLNCTERKVRFVVRGETKEIAVPGGAFLASALQFQDVRKLLRSSSDLSRIKVKRTDSKTRKTREILVYAQANEQAHGDLWLRDGDVIEVSDKP